MKAKINLIVVSDAYEEVEEIEELICGLIEDEGMKVIWKKSEEAD
jgi:hypothetical protein